MNEKEYFICTIDFDDLVTEDVVVDGTTSIKSFGTSSIYVFRDEGPNIPHFHIKSDNIKKDRKTKNKTKETCVEIFYPRYFIHGSKQDILNRNEFEKLNKILNEPNKRCNNKTNWEFIRDKWIEFFPYCENQCRDIEKPNYNIILPGKIEGNIQAKIIGSVSDYGCKYYIAKTINNTGYNLNIDQLIVIANNVDESKKITTCKIERTIYTKDRTGNVVNVWFSYPKGLRLNQNLVMEIFDRYDLEFLKFTKDWKI